MERMRNLNSGLGQCCLHLGHALAASPVQDCHFEAYLPARLGGIFGENFSYRPVRKWQKITGVSTHNNLWHCMHQDSAYLPKDRQTRLSMTIHDLNFLERADYSERKKNRKTGLLQKRINRCAGLVYVSGFVKEQVHARLKIPAGIPEAVVYNGVPAPASVVPRPGATPCLFSIGLHPKKNYAAALPILQSRRDWQWVIAGGDDKGYRQELTRAAEKLGVAGRLEFPGVITEQEKWEWYATCAALVFPSTAEGFGLPVLEAMSFGKPVFLSKCTSLPEIGGPEAYYFSDFEPDSVIDTFQNGMTDFENDPEKAQRLKAWAMQFTWENTAREYLNFFQAILR